MHAARTGRWALTALAACLSCSPSNGVPGDATTDASPDGRTEDEADAGPSGEDGGTNGGAGTDPAVLFDSAEVPTYALAFTREDWDALQDDWGQDVPVTVRYEGEVYEGVGVHYKGNVSLDYAGDKKSLKLDFDEFHPGQRLHGLEHLALHNGFKDPTLIRENLAYALHAAAGDLASRTGHARVTITVPGLYDDEYFGLYVVVEPIDRHYVREWLGDDDGTLYEGGDFRWYGPDWREYVPYPYEPKTNRDSNDHEALLRFLQVLNETPDGELADALEAVFDVDHFLGWLAANTILANMDGIPGGGGNCWLVHDTRTDRMVLIPWDMNESFGSTSEGLSVEELLHLDVHEPVVYPGAQPLIERVLEVPRFRADYDDRLRALVEGAFSPAQMDARIEELRDRIRDAVYADTKRHYSIEQFEDAFDVDVPGLPNPPYPDGNVVIGLRRFVRERGASVAAQLE